MASPPVGTPTACGLHAAAARVPHQCVVGDRFEQSTWTLTNAPPMLQPSCSTQPAKLVANAVWGASATNVQQKQAEMEHAAVAAPAP